MSVPPHYSFLSCSIFFLNHYHPTTIPIKTQRPITHFISLWNLLTFTFLRARLRESEKRESETERERTWRTRELEGEIQRLKKKIGPDLPWIDDGRRPVDGSTPVKLEVDSGEPKSGFLVVITDQIRAGGPTMMLASLADGFSPSVPSYCSLAWVVRGHRRGMEKWKIKN